MIRTIKILAIVLIAAVVTACGATAPHQISEEEVAEAWGGQAYSDLLVMGVYTDRAYRASIEAVVAEELKTNGVKASTSNEGLSQMGNSDSDSAITELLASRNHDAVLVVSTVEEGYDYDAGDYLATRGWVAMLGGEPGVGTDVGSFIAWADSGAYSLYVGLYDAKTQEAMWQVTTDSDSTGSESEDAKALAQFVVQTLKAKGML